MQKRQLHEYHVQKRKKCTDCIQLFQFRLSDESFKRTQRDRKVLWVVVNWSLLGFAVYAFVSAMSELDVSTVNVCLRVLKENNKFKYDSYCLRGVPSFDNVKSLKKYLLERCRDDMRPASDTTFRMGYYGEKHQKFSITSEVQLAEALSLVKRGLVALWVDPHFPKDDAISGKKRKGELL